MLPPFRQRSAGVRPCTRMGLLGVKRGFMLGAQPLGLLRVDRGFIVTPHHTISHHTISHHTTPHHTTPYYTTPLHITSHPAIGHSKIFITILSQYTPPPRLKGAPCPSRNRNRCCDGTHYEGSSLRSLHTRGLIESNKNKLRHILVLLGD